MKIKFKREGGFVGITSKASLEFDKLTTEEQNALTSLAQQSLDTEMLKEISAPNALATPQSEARPSEMVSDTPVFNEQGLELAGPQMPTNGFNPNMRDGFSYSVSMKKDGKMMSLKFDDTSAPPAIVEIFQKYVQY
jgi:hypothetical protein